MIKILAAITGLFLLVIPVITFGAVASSSNYQLERDSINIGGLLSSSTNNQLEDTAGELASGTSTSASYLLKAGYQQMELSYITITSPADVTLTPAISEDTGGVADGSTSWTVSTNSTGGYSLSIRATTNPALQSSGASFADYAPAGAAPDFAWSVASTNRYFGFSPEGSAIATRYKDNGSTCNVAGSDTTLKCWDGFSTSNQIIAGLSAPTGGSATAVNFRAEAGSSNNPPDGSYAATIIVTAIAQ